MNYELINPHRLFCSKNNLWGFWWAIIRDK